MIWRRRRILNVLLMWNVDGGGGGGVYCENNVGVCYEIDVDVDVVVGRRNRVVVVGRACGLARMLTPRIATCLCGGGRVSLCCCCCNRTSIDSLDI